MSAHVLTFTIPDVSRFDDVDGEIVRRVTRYTRWAANDPGVTRAVDTAEVRLILTRRAERNGLDRWTAHVKVSV